MINILKLRKLEKENKQRKLQEEKTLPEESLIMSEVITEEKISAKNKTSPKKTKVKSANKKSGKHIEELPGDQLPSDNVITVQTDIVEPDKKEAEQNPVEIFRQSLLNELLNSDSLPEFSTQISEAEPTQELIEQTEDLAQLAKHAVVPENQGTTAVKEIVNQPVIADTKLNDVNKPDQLDNFNHAIEKSKKIHDSLIHIVSFSLGKENYGVDIMRIREIIRMVDITKVPRAPEFIEGVINLRGSVIPVINLRTRIKLPGKEYDKSTRIIVMELKQAVIGFIVDEVKEVLRISESVIAPPPLLTVGKKVEYITAVAKLENSLIILIEPERLLSGNELEKLK